MDHLLIEAARDGNLQLIRELLNRGANVHFASDWPLFGAVQNGHLNIVRELLDREPIDTWNPRAMIIAARMGSWMIIREFLSRGLSPRNPFVIQAMNDAAMRSEILVVQEFLAYGVDPNTLLSTHHYMIPQTLTPSEYYQIESSISSDIRELPNKFVIRVSDKTYFIMK